MIESVHAFGKDHRNQSLWAQREFYLPLSLWKSRNSKINMWGSFRCSCLPLTFFPLPPPHEDNSSTDWTIERKTARCSTWSGPPTGYSCEFSSFADTARESLPSPPRPLPGPPPVEVLKFLILCCCNSAGQFFLNSLGTERGLQLPSDQNCFIISSWPSPSLFRLVCAVLHYQRMHHSMFRVYLNYRFVSLFVY